nr:hypothetical protein [Tanacetum cinerariifolium]
MPAENNKGDSSCWNINKLDAGHAAVNVVGSGNGNESGNEVVHSRFAAGR